MRPTTSVFAATKGLTAPNGHDLSLAASGPSIGQPPCRLKSWTGRAAGVALAVEGSAGSGF